MKQPVQEGMFETRFRMWTERGGRIRLEPSERWVRASLGGTVVADSKRVQLLYLPPPLNSYAFPRADVRWDLVRESDDVGSMPGLGEVKHWSVSAGGKVAHDAAWTFPEPPQGLEALSDPRDPYHRVDVLNSSRHVKVTVDGELVAETRRPRLLFETSLPVRYYIPRLDVRMNLLEPSGTTSRCPYKGEASYWSVRAGTEVQSDLAWSYKFPIPECPKIENLIAFFNERVDLDVDGERLERPITPWSRTR